VSTITATLRSVFYNDKCNKQLYERLTEKTNHRNIYWPTVQHLTSPAITVPYVLVTSLPQYVWTKLFSNHAVRFIDMN